MRNLQVVACLGLLLGIGCSNSDSPTMDGGTGETGSEASDPGAAFKSACAEYGKSLCARTWACGDGTSTDDDEQRVAARPAESQQACADATAAECVAVHLLKGVLETPDDILACAQKTTTTCTTYPPHCGKKGSLSDGSSCGMPMQCASGVCAGAFTGTCGKCGTPKAMSLCSFHSDCAGIGTNLYCRDKAFCEVPKKLDDPCTDKDLAEEGLVCFNGKVVKMGGAGDPCNGNGPRCGLGFGCDTTQHCALIKIGGPGAECNTAVTGCTPDLTCNIDADGGLACAKHPAFNGEGMNCTNGAVCKPDLLCVNLAVNDSRCQKPAMCN